MKFAAEVTGAFSRALIRRTGAAAAAAGEAAADVLAHELERSKEESGVSVPLIRERQANNHVLGVQDPEAINRELGTLTEAPSPWLAPVLPAARGPMRAAAQNAVTRAISRSPKIR